MDRLHARYPFLEAAREAVAAADIDLAALVRAEHRPAVDRAVERIEGAIVDGRTPDPGPDIRVELLSYPIARVLVSLIDEPALTDRFALAEARRAIRLLEADLDGRDRQFGSAMTRGRLLAEFDLADGLRETASGYDLGVTAYLSLTEDLRDDRWRLLTRSLSNGFVAITAAERDDLLREAIRRRVADGLPLEVPAAIATPLEPVVESLEASFADVAVPDDLDRVVPDQFPPCMAALLEELRDGVELSPLERMTIVSFLTGIGLEADELVEFIDPDSLETAQQLRYAADHLHGGTSSTAYPPPSCRTLEAAGHCKPNAEDCRRIGHPLAAYAAAIEEGAAGTAGR